MNKIELLAQESAPLLNNGREAGLTFVSMYGDGNWVVTVHVERETAVQYADDADAATPVMQETSRDLDAVLDLMLDRVRAAVAGITAEAVA